MGDLQKQKYYSNSVKVSSNTFDFQLSFNLKTIDNSGKEQVEELTTVCMSPQHAKVLLNILNNHIRNYEEHLGEIQLEPKQEVQKAK